MVWDHPFNQPYQQIEKIPDRGRLARKYRLNFYGEDLRPGYRRSREISKNLASTASLIAGVSSVNGIVL